MRTLARLSFDAEVGHKDCKKYLQHRFKVTAGADALAISFEYGPQMVEGGRNLITMSLFDPKGFRGASHRGPPVQHVEIGPSSATPGYLPGRLSEGDWTVELETHWIHPGCSCRYQLVIDVLSNGTGQGETSRARMYPDIVVNPAEGWYRGDLHTHTNHSDAVVDVPGLLSTAKEHGLDFVALTDHNTISGLGDFLESTVPGLLTIPGMELTTYWGHALALGITEWIDWRTGHLGRTMTQSVEETARRSGVFVIAHPIDLDDQVCTGCRWRYEDMMPGSAHAVEVWNGAWEDFDNEQSLRLWYGWLNKGHRIPATSGTDCHTRECRSLQELHAALNVVGARSLSRGAILEGIRKGRLYLSSGPEVRIWGGSDAGQRVPMGGTILQGDRGVEIEWRKCPEGSTFHIIVNGTAAEAWKAPSEGSRTWNLPEVTRWCVVELRDANGQMLALTNPIYANR